METFSLVFLPKVHFLKKVCDILVPRGRDPFGQRQDKRIVACVAGVQRGGRGEVECEREARSLGARTTIALSSRSRRASRSHSTLVALRARIQLPPSLPFVRRPRRLKGSRPLGREWVCVEMKWRVQRALLRHNGLDVLR